jgi:predicted metal-dependent peptidase
MIEIADTQTKEELTDERFKKIMLKFLLNEPFFSDIMSHIRRQKTYAIPTAGVSCAGGDFTLHWNPDFVGKLTTKKVFGLLKHECYHLIYQHVSGRKQKPHLMWNIATDLAINSTIPLDELPEGGLVPGQATKFPADYTPAPAQVKMSEFIKSMPLNKSSEWYMEKIMNDEEIQEAIQEAMGEGSCEDGFGEGNGNGNGDSKSDAGNGRPGQGFDHHFDEELSDAEKAMADAKIKEIVKKAAKRASKNRSWGSVGASMQGEIQAMFSDEIDWRNVLRYFCGSKQKANRSRTFKRINKKYPYIHPGRKTSYTSNIAVYIDQSGSVGDHELQLLFNTLNELAKRVTFTIYHFDTSVDEASEFVWKKNKTVRKAYRTRGGGTCFNCVEDHFRKNIAKYDGYIIMTDGYAPKPKPCKSKRCWVIIPGCEPQFQIDKKDTKVVMKE